MSELHDPTPTPISAWPFVPGGYTCRTCGDRARQNPVNSIEWGCATCGASSHSLFFCFVKRPAAPVESVSAVLFPYLMTLLGERACWQVEYKVARRAEPTAMTGFLGMDFFVEKVYTVLCARRAFLDDQFIVVSDDARQAEREMISIIREIG